MIVLNLSIGKQIMADLMQEQYHYKEAALADAMSSKNCLIEWERKVEERWNAILRQEKEHKRKEDL